MNLSYCRFENTLKDLRVCDEHLFDLLTVEEAKAREQLVRVCMNIVEAVNLKVVPVIDEPEDEAIERAIGGLLI